jgi:hypothetical protein
LKLEHLWAHVPFPSCRTFASPHEARQKLILWTLIAEVQSMLSSMG